MMALQKSQYPPLRVRGYLAHIGIMTKLFTMVAHGYVLRTRQFKNRQTLLRIGLNMLLKEKQV